MPKPNRCYQCDAELPQGQTGICQQCASEQARRQAAYYLPPPDPAPVFIPAPPVGMHIAGPLVDGVQRCSRCGCVLATTLYTTTYTVPKSAYHEGSWIERGKGWQAIYVGASRQPNCEAPKAEAVA